MILTAYEVTATADVERRTISGVCVPYEQPGNPSGADGPVVFASGAFARSLSERADRVRLVMDHDVSRPVGRLDSFEDTPAGLVASFRVASTPAGDLALTEAAEGVRDGLSVGCEVVRSSPARGALTVLEARLREVSLVALPAFDAARVQRVAATDNIPPIAGRDPRVMRLRLMIGDAR